MNCRALTILLTTTRSSTFAFAPQSAAFSVASSTRHLGIATITQGGGECMLLYCIIFLLDNVGESYYT